jgi:hypothetical protein
MQFLAFLLALSPLLALGNESTWSRRRAHHKRAVSSRATSFNLVKKYQGQDFFKCATLL